MSSGNTVEIHDKSAFPAKIKAVRDAVAQLRTAANALSQISDTATAEAGSFTRDSSPAPIYKSLLEALGTWQTTIASAVKAVCDSSENCATTAEYKFNGITATDTAAAGAVQNA